MAFVHPSRAGYVPEDRYESGSRDQNSRRTERRASPSYEYERPPEPKQAPYQSSNGHMSFFDKRREQREQSHFSIWAPSPPPSDESDSEAEARDRKKRKHKKDKKHSSSSKKSSKKRRHRYSDESEDSEDERERRHRRKSHKSSSSRRRSTSRDRSRDRSSRKDKEARRRSPSPAEEDLWVEKGGEARPSSSRDLVPSTSTSRPEASTSRLPTTQDESSDDEVGPMPAKQIDMKADPRSYGGALRPGEGSAIANFVASGERIPRRGEIGLESHEIEKFEAAGYVMSGSRHRRMNAIRMRKENQVISAEEQRGLLKMQMEEKAKREQDIVTSFKELVQEKLTDTKKGGK